MKILVQTLAIFRIELLQQSAPVMPLKKTAFEIQHYSISKIIILKKEKITL